MQRSFASLEFAQKKRVTRREKFLAEMDQVGFARQPGVPDGREGWQRRCQRLLWNGQPIHKQATRLASPGQEYEDIRLPLGIEPSADTDRLVERMRRQSK
jgi:hypothetical protein